MFPPMWHDQFQEELKKHLDAKKSSNKAFSMRSFAQKLNLSPGSLSEMLRGQRKVSLKKAIEILSLLPDAEPQLTAELERLAETETKKRLVLPEHAYQIVSKWQYLALTMLFNCDTKISTEKEVSRRLGLSEEEVASALDLLIANGLVKKSPEGYYQATGIGWSTTDGIPSTVIRDSHADGLRLAEKALHELPVEIRDFTSIVFPGDHTKLESARKEIRRFRDRMTRLMQGTATDSVYRLAVQFFPVDQWEKK